MAVERACPHCGKPLRPGPGEPNLRATGLLGSGSDDGELMSPNLGLGRVAVAEPDPILGEFRESPARPGTKDLFPSLDFSAPIGPRKAARPVGSGPSTSSDDEPDGPAAKPWALILLGSYASATTLALVGALVLQKRHAAPAAIALPVAPAEIRPGQGRQGSLSRVVEPPAPIAVDRYAEPRKPLRIGSLEITPLECRRQEVTLQKTNFSGQVDRRSGGKGALILRLRLRNTSETEVFAPIDQAFVRERGEGLVDTFVEAADKSRIFPFPLAVESELSVVGQDFTELRPGETRDVVIATGPDAPGDDQGPFTWRVHLRTGVDRTDVIGVRWAEKPAGDRSNNKKS